MNRVKQILVTRSSMPTYEEYCEEIKDLWESRWLTNNGSKHNKLAENLKEYLHTSNATLFTNGHLALETVLSAFDLSGEVITTPFTFVSTTHAITRNGLTPVFCDVNEQDYTMDTSKIESLITDKTCAIVPVHVYGNICNYVEIEKIAKKHNLKVIYDAAHAFGCTIDGKNVANLGDASMFSFHATKVFNTIEGGCVCYDNNELSGKLDAIKNFGMCTSDDVDFVGTNCKMNEFQAAMGLCNLKHLDEEIAKRKQVVLKYKELLSNVKGIKLCEENEKVCSNYAYFPVVFDGYKLNRDEIMQKLAKENIFARKYFYPLTNDISCYNYDVTDTPIAKYISDRVLTLPLYADLTLEDVGRICEIILR